MGFMMMDADKGTAQREGERLSGFQADQQSVGQSRPLGGGDRVKAFKFDTRLPRGGPGDGNQLAQVFARSQLGNDPAKFRVERYL